MPFEIVRNDIVKMKVDIIVNTANPYAEIGSGVDWAIHSAAGPELFKEREKIGEIRQGEARITPAFNLDARYVIHTVGPIWNGGNDKEAECLKACYENSLKLALDYKCKSIAFPLLATGNYGFPKDEALNIAVSTISAFLMKNNMMVYLVVFNDKAYELSEKLFKDIESYIDENYIRQKLDEEYKVDIGKRLERNRRVKKELLFESMDNSCIDWIPANTLSLESMLENEEKTFSEALFDWLLKKDLKDPDVYKKANMDRKLFSKIRNKKDYKPSKNTALALAIALELDIDETKDFIGKAGYALTHSSKFDIIIEYFIMKKNYNVFEINEVLFAYNYPLIGG